MMLDLNSKYATIVRKILAQHIPHKTVWVYGSRIKEKSHEGSDLDLIIMSSVTQQELSAVRAALAESNLPILIDVTDWSNIPEKFKSEIEKKHEVFQSL